MAKKPVAKSKPAKPKADAPVTMAQMRDYVRGYARGVVHMQKRMPRPGR